MKMQFSLNRYKAMAEVDSYKVIELTVEGPNQLAQGIGRKVSLVSKNDFRGGMNFSIKFLLTQPLCDTPVCSYKAYGMTLEGSEKSGDAGFAIKGL